MARTILILLLCVASGSALADVLLIEPVRQAENMTLPENGLSKSDVQAQWGEPLERHSAVGEPPIGRWDYDRFSVYFEYDTVLSTVLRTGEVLDG